MTMLFVSYSRDDAATVDPIVEQLEDRLRFDLWIDRYDLKPGTPESTEAMDEALKRADGVLAFLSPTAKKSKWCTKETRRAQQFEKPIYPILLSGNVSDIIPLHLEDIQYTDMRKEANRKENLEHLIDTLKNKFQHEAPAHETDTDSRGNAVISEHVEGNNISTQQQTQTPIQRVRNIIGKPFDWVHIPAGEVTLENNMGTYQVEAFQIAKYAITNAQFDAFTKHGYNDAQWWRYSDDAWQWHKNKPKPDKKAFAGEPDHPRVRVSWYDAVAFCLWLSEQSGQQIMLPTEQQWQRAGQGDDGRTYAWGNEDPTEKLANYWKQNKGQTTAVDSYEKQARHSPYRLYNMTGNVWEWCRTDYVSGAEDITANAKYRVLRGGCWGNSTDYIRLAYRGSDIPPDRLSDCDGFRIARSY